MDYLREWSQSVVTEHWRIPLCCTRYHHRRTWSRTAKPRDVTVARNCTRTTAAQCTVHTYTHTHWHINNQQYQCHRSAMLWHCWLGGRKGMPVKKLSGAVLAWLSVCSEVQTSMWPRQCHCQSLSLASVKSRLVLPFWYRLTWVVPVKGPLNGCVCVWSAMAESTTQCLAVWQTVT